MKHYSRINILLTVNSGERIVTGCAGMRPQHTDVIMDAWPAPVHGGGEIYLKTVKILQSSSEWSEISSYCTKILHKENMEEERQIQIVTQNNAGV